MADNVDITPGTGKTVAADDIGGVLHQRVKLSVGADGEAADLDHGQAAMAASLLVVIASNQSAVPVSDGGGALTVDGTVAVTSAGITTLAGAVAGTEMQVDVVAALPAGTNAIGKLAANSGVDIGDVDVASIAAGDNNIGNVDIASAIPAGENVIGLVGASDIVVTVTPTLDANAYAGGDLLFDSTEVAAAVRANGGTAILQTVTMLDKADQGVAMTLVFANAATDFGALNSAPDPDDTEAATVIGHVAVLAGDYIDLGANRVACIRNIGLMLKAGAATTSIYIAGINGTGTPTYANGDLVIQLGFMRS